MENKTFISIECEGKLNNSEIKVLIYEENFPFDPQDKIKFLYTAITRAQDKVILVRA